MTNSVQTDLFFDNVEPAFEYIDEIEFERGSKSFVRAVKLDEIRDVCALKKIWIDDPGTLKNVYEEVKLLSKLNHDSVVKFYGIWIEDEEFIYILMELCKENLYNVLERKHAAFNRLAGEPIKITEYRGSWHILYKIVEAVRYLHSLSPPETGYRVLKPSNILITDTTNGQLIKLCDFASSRLHLYPNHIRNHMRKKGTLKYMAPEIIEGWKYNIKSDIFAIAVIALEIFGFQLPELRIYNRKKWSEYFETRPENIYFGTELQDKINILVDIMKVCITAEEKACNDRPSCDELLERLKLCSINLNDSSYTTFGDGLHDFLSSLRLGKN